MTGDVIHNSDLAEPDMEKHVFINRLQEECPAAAQAIVKALEISLAKFIDGKIDFKCDAGTVALIFGTAGFTDAKTIARHISVNGREPSEATLRSWKTNTPPREWEGIKNRAFFKTTRKQEKNTVGILVRPNK
jgi:hypothetical protein